jgi:hypothetical protein
MKFGKRQTFSDFVIYGGFHGGLPAPPSGLTMQKHNNSHTQLATQHLPVYLEPCAFLS